MKILFVCNQNKNRSKLAEEIFSAKYETKSAGLYAGNPLTEAALEWADLVAVMEDFQRQEVASRFPKQYLKKRILTLGISDVYSKDDPALAKLLVQKFNACI